MSGQGHGMSSLICVNVHGMQHMTRWEAGPCHEHARMRQGAWQAAHDKNAGHGHAMSSHGMMRLEAHAQPLCMIICFLGLSRKICVMD
jgi:hypothetical protein